jgi:NAD(P)-dependent dehydrogenase (short-subunit alcohol dehydrogenase family)
LSPGIARHHAIACAWAGAQVAVCSRKLEGVQSVAAEIESAGGQALAVQAHVGRAEEVAALVARVLEVFGRVDVVVNNAATNPHFGPLLTADDGQWMKILDTNVMGAVRVCGPLRYTEKQGGGRSSTSRPSLARPSPGMGVYGVSKAAIIMLTQRWRASAANIQVNAIAPGVIKTHFSEVLWQTPQIAEPILSRTPLGRFGEPEDVAGLALFLASPASDYVTGGVFVVDGGLNVALAMG